LGWLLREGLDLPEVSLVAILDADKEGFYVATVRLRKLGRAAETLMERKRYMPIKSLPVQKTIDETDYRKEQNKLIGEQPGSSNTEQIECL
jgi:excinuclease ABC subunit B